MTTVLNQFLGNREIKPFRFGAGGDSLQDVVHTLFEVFSPVGVPRTEWEIGNDLLLHLSHLGPQNANSLPMNYYCCMYGNVQISDYFYTYTGKSLMEHAEKRMAGRYVKAFSWHKSIRAFLNEVVKESPILNVCSGPQDDFGDLRVDRYVRPLPPGVIADWTHLPFASNSFAAVFADPPWNLAYMKPCADFCKEALRIAPVVYVMSPWLWVERNTKRTGIWVREFPGVNVPILLVRYERDQYWLDLGN